jgi:serine/threonine-protein kinase
MIGQAISHYRIVEKIGEGGMGEVYRARDTKLNRHVALKVFSDSLLQDRDSQRRFTREALSAAGIDHPSICKIYEVGNYEGLSFIAMELFKGMINFQTLPGRHL